MKNPHKMEKFGENNSKFKSPSHYDVNKLDKNCFTNIIFIDTGETYAFTSHPTKAYFFCGVTRVPCVVKSLQC